MNSAHFPVRAPTASRLACFLAPAVLLAVACSRRGGDPETSDGQVAAGSVRSAAGAPELPVELLDAGAEKKPAPGNQSDTDRVDPAADWQGPWLLITKTAAAIYSAPSFEKTIKRGYARNGGRVAIQPSPVSRTQCTGGWFEVVGGGYVCGNLGTTDGNDRELRYTVKQPNLDDVLPYVYARNTKHGTPLYKSVPTPDQIREYEPYLYAPAPAPSSAADDGRSAGEERGARGGELASAAAVNAGHRGRERTVRARDVAAEGRPDEAPHGRPQPALARQETDTTLGGRALAGTREAAGFRSAGAPPRPAGEQMGSPIPTVILGDTAPPQSSAEPMPPVLTEEQDVSWWKDADAGTKLHEVTLEQMRAEADDVLDMRMMKGFYVAVDKTFRWNDRLWYKTTKGKVAPADRLGQVAGSSFHGVELGKGGKLPVGWVYGQRKSTTAYQLDERTADLKPLRTIQAFEAIALSGQTRKVGKDLYAETVDGSWVKSSHLRIAQASAPPADVAPNERWLDVAVSSQTLVAYQGSEPKYATLVSTGKESSVKEKDHRTPRGEWRIREKHLTTTMDGDGTAAGDLPYSIEDVPFAAFFHRSYALHGAFWHRNYGTQMSHGCVNLAPLDAKYLFFFVDPQLPRGWHGVWSSEEHPGTLIRIRD